MLIFCWGGGILTAVVICWYFSDTFKQIDSRAIRDIFTRDIYLVGLLYIGRIFRKYQQYIPVSLILLSGTFVLLLIAEYYGVRVSMVSSKFPSLPIFYFVSVVGFLFVYCLAIYIQHSRRANLIMTYIGNASLSIMALHFLAFKIVSLLEIWIYGYDITYLSQFPVIEAHSALWWLPYTVIGTFLPLIYVHIKQHSSSYVQQFYNYALNLKIWKS